MQQRAAGHSLRAIRGKRRLTITDPRHLRPRQLRLGPPRPVASYAIEIEFPDRLAKISIYLICKPRLCSMESGEGKAAQDGVGPQRAPILSETEQNRHG